MVRRAVLAMIASAALMAVGSVSLGGLGGRPLPPPLVVDCLSDRFEVVGIDAVTDTTEVVDRKAARDRGNHYFVGEPMNDGCPAGDTESDVAVAIPVNCAGPEPARISELGFVHETDERRLNDLGVANVVTPPAILDEAGVLGSMEVAKAVLPTAPLAVLNGACSILTHLEFTPQGVLGPNVSALRPTYILPEHDPLYAYVYDPGFELPRPAPAPQAQVMAATGALTEGEARAILTAAGWPVELHDQALAIAHCESRHRPDAVGDGGNSLGWFQLWYGWFSKAGFDRADYADPFVNASVARYVYEVRGRWGGGGGWSCAALVGLE